MPKHRNRRQYAAARNRRLIQAAVVVALIGIVGAILIVKNQSTALIYGAALLFVYALGRGVPVVLAGTFTGALKQLRGMARWTELIEKAAGVIIIAVGIYLIWIA
ncbi:MAG: cytochrome c biogenesis protein CcdA [Candidatus Roseilinea sp.]|uniref:cytochrome c biogenesis protein CcdA n=1 Tax=Candidatus Roseilinea sp. TaxID=2838777 RepID=UPI00404911B6